jgi:alanyl-tRNA synthetase
VNVLEELEEKVIAVMLLAPQWRLAVKAWRGAMKKGVHAGKLTAVIAKAAGGRGGGQPYLGQAGGVDADAFEGARKAIDEALRAQLG